MHDHRPAEAGARDSGMLPPDARESYERLRRVNLFDGIPNDELSAAIASGAIRRRILRRDVFVADPVAAPRDAELIYVIDGQLAVGAFDPGDFADRKAYQDRYDRMSEAERREESALAPPPLARVARKNLAVFFPGDVFNAAAVAAQRDLTVAFFTTAPSEIAVISGHAISELVLRYPFFERRLRRAVEVGRERLANVTGVKQEILDFFVRQGLSVSGERVRVRQLDLCIDCKQCEDACEERYGARRLTLGGYHLGMLDFIYTCRTCTDQRCVDPCEYDSIQYDPDAREVVINEATCTGCTLCAQLCPYGAIEMVDVEDPEHPNYREAFRIRLDADGKLKFGPGTGRVARPRRVANKCDHCATYSDQACVTACPTGSLIEVNAYDLFRERSELARVLARAGYDAEVKPSRRDRRELLPVAPFIEGAHVHDGGLAKIKRFRVGAAIAWVLGLTAFFVCLAEILLRLYAPTKSFQYWFLVKTGEPETIARLQVGFRAGDTLAVWCGYIGTFLLLISVLYPVVRRINSFRLVANAKLWFDFHMMAGTVGPMFIVLHSALKLDNWVSAAFWSMVIVVISGIVGRYLYTQVPDLVNGRELEELDHRRAFNRYRRQYPDAVQLCERELAAHEQKAQHIAARAGLVRTLLWILSEDMKRPARWLRRRVRFRAAAAPRGVVRDLRVRTGRMLLIDRRRVLGERAQLVLHSWKKVHVPFSFIMAAISVVHIWLAFQYSM